MIHGSYHSASGSLPSMVSLTVPIPSLQLRSRSEDWDVVAYGSLQLRQSNVAIVSLSSFESVCSAVSKDQLWIKRSGPCFLKLSVTVSGRLLEGNGLRKVGQEVKSFEVSRYRDCRLHQL